jgi:acetyl esterase/lipase
MRLWWVIALAIAGGLVLAGPASADMASLKASCVERDAADNSVSNGLQLPYVYCDDGVPPTGGRIPNEGAIRGLAVPERYGGDGYSGLPPKTTPDPGSGADSNGDITLDADVSMPDPSRYPPPPGGYPLIVMMHGCCQGWKKDWESDTIDAPGQTENWHYSNAWFASRGYVVLNYTARGFVDQNNQGSTGVNQLDSRRYEINDYQYLAGLLADDPFFHIDPQRVVTTGGSYGGGFSWLTLTDPTWTSPGGKAMRLVATAPRYGWTDLVYSLVPTGFDMVDQLPPFDGSASMTPLGMPKRTVIAALFGTGNELTSRHTVFPPDIDQAFACTESITPAPENPLCLQTLQQVLPRLIQDSSAYYQNAYFQRLQSGDPSAVVPVFSAGTETDPLFTDIEHRRMAQRLQSLDPSYPIEQYYGDYEHFVQNKRKEWADLCGADRHVCTMSDYGADMNAAPADLVAAGVTSRLDRFIDYYARPPGDASPPPPPMDVTASLQICPENASSAYPADGPGPRFTAATFDGLAPNRLTITMRGSQTTTNLAAPNTHALDADPLSNLAAHSGHCPVEHSSGGAATAGPGVATYDSAPLRRPYTMIGSTQVTVPHTGTGSDLQLDARLYDLYPDGTQVMVDRGPRRLLKADETTVFDLHGNGWSFPRGHRIRIELAQDDDPYLQASNVPSSLTLSGVTLSIPVREASATLSGAGARRVAARLRLIATPRRVRTGHPIMFTFRVLSIANGHPGPVPRALVHFAGHRVRTGRGGRARLRLTLHHAGTYIAVASRHGYRSAKARVHASRSPRQARPQFTG